MKRIFQVALQDDGSGVKKWVDIGSEAYGFHKQMGRDVREVWQNPPLPPETLVNKDKDADA